MPPVRGVVGAKQTTAQPAANREHRAWVTGSFLSPWCAHGQRWGGQHVARACALGTCWGHRLPGPLRTVKKGNQCRRGWLLAALGNAVHHRPRRTWPLNLAGTVVPPRPLELRCAPATMEKKQPGAHARGLRVWLCTQQPQECPVSGGDANGQAQRGPLHRRGLYGALPGRTAEGGRPTKEVRWVNGHGGPPSAASGVRRGHARGWGASAMAEPEWGGCPGRAGARRRWAAVTV